MSLSNLIYEHLKNNYPKIIHKGELGKLAVTQWGYENENMGRRCRELESKGLIRKVPDKKGRAMYQYVDQEPLKPKFKMIKQWTDDGWKRKKEEIPQIKVNQLSMF